MTSFFGRRGQPTCPLSEKARSRRTRSRRFHGFQTLWRPYFFAAFFVFRLAFRAAPALKRAFFEAAILISLPVAGLRPLPAARSRTENVPKPTGRTSSPFLRDLAIPSRTASRAAAALTLVSSASVATCSTSSSLFIWPLL